jgi:hypothetical protein
MLNTALLASTNSHYLLFSRIPLPGLIVEYILRVFLAVLIAKETTEQSELPYKNYILTSLLNARNLLQSVELLLYHV